MLHPPKLTRCVFFTHCSWLALVSFVVTSNSLCCFYHFHYNQQLYHRHRYHLFHFHSISTHALSIFCFFSLCSFSIELGSGGRWTSLEHKKPLCCLIACDQVKYRWLFRHQLMLSRMTRTRAVAALFLALASAPQPRQPPMPLPPRLCATVALLCHRQHQQQHYRRSCSLPLLILLKGAGEIGLLEQSCRLDPLQSLQVDHKLLKNSN